MQDRSSIFTYFFSVAKIILFFTIILCFTGCIKSPTNDEITGKEYFDLYGCKICHSLSGQEMYGPPLDGLYNKKIEVLRSGDTNIIIADRRYIIRSITEPEFEKVLQYSNRTMPETELSAEKAKVITDYLISVNENRGK